VLLRAFDTVPGKIRVADGSMMGDPALFERRPVRVRERQLQRSTDAHLGVSRESVKATQRVDAHAEPFA